jgi:hypothetical protein
VTICVVIQKCEVVVIVTKAQSKLTLTGCFVIIDESLALFQDWNQRDNPQSGKM